VSGALLAIQSSNTSPAPPSGTVLFSSSVAGSWSYTSTVTGNIVLEGWAGGGPGYTGSYVKGGSSFPGAGGGGGGYFRLVVAITVGDILSGNIGAGGNVVGPTAGGATTCPGQTLNANGGTAALFSTHGNGGTASGGSTNTTGHNGSATNLWSGGGAGNGGGDQNSIGGAGTLPGGGSAGANFGVAPKSGQNGQIKITVA
jgi:hypothetical protein